MSGIKIKGVYLLYLVNKCCFLVLSPSDPHHRDLYVNSSDYLALLNSERSNPNSTGQRIINECNHWWAHVYLYDAIEVKSIKVKSEC